MPTDKPTDTPQAESSSGRPRDPATERRALAAALDLFGRRGWSGFTIGGVAAQARVGKSAIYLRWQNKEGLLLAAFDEFEAFFEHPCPDCTTFRERMHALVLHRSRTYFLPTGLAVIRLHAEYRSDPARFEGLWRATFGKAVLAQRRRLQKAAASGQLKPETDIIVLGDALEGAMLMHALATPADLAAKALDQLSRTVDIMVDRILDPWLTPLANQPDQASFTTTETAGYSR